MVIDVDERGGKVQLCDLPVVERVPVQGLTPGGRLDVRLASADRARRTVSFELVGGRGVPSAFALHHLHEIARGFTVRRIIEYV